MADIHVLVVDNSPVIRRILRYVLEAEGCRVDVAEDGLVALDCIARQRPDIIFLDLVMPKIDGEKLGFILRNTPELRDIFLVILSGIALEDYESTLRIGADVCIAKGTATAMKVHVKAALERYRTHQRGLSPCIEGMEGLYPREVIQELLGNKRHREVVLTHMSEGVVELNHQGRIVMVNRMALHFFELPEAQVLGASLARLLPQDAGERINGWMNRILPMGRYVSLAFTYDEPIVVGERQLTCTLVPVPEDGTFFVIAILRDVSRRKAMELRQRQLEKELERIRKLDAMSIMAGGIAHDFNNLLTVISGNLEMAQYIGRDEQVNQLLGESAKALNLTMQLVRRFSTFSDNYLPRKSQVRLSGLIKDILADALASTGIDFHLTISTEDPAITLDPDLVRQVFTNLANNAVEAMGNVGHIEIEIDQVDGAKEAARTGQPIPSGALARITFHDSGPGMAPTLISQAFDPYFSTKQKGIQKGMGLGLTIVHGIIKKHGGLVWIDSPVGGGCTVVLYFPIQARELRSVDGTWQVKVQPGCDRRVLLMDDEEMMRLITCKMFERCGCMVSMVSSGEEAVALFHRQMDAGHPFGVCLLDLRVHGGMGGLEAARRIVEIDPDAKLVAVSGDPGLEGMELYSEHHFVAALAKPFSMDEVEEIVRRFL